MLTDIELLDSQDALKGYAWKLTRNREEARDLLADTNLRVLEKRHLYSDRGRGPKVWLCCVMRSVFVSKLRSASRAKIPYRQTFIEPTAPWRVLAIEVAEAVSKLGPERAEIVRAAAAGIAWEEIAKKQRIPIGTVRSRINRARTQLAEFKDF